jgi:hypothetical protein
VWPIWIFRTYEAYFHYLKRCLRNKIKQKRGG